MLAVVSIILLSCFIFMNADTNSNEEIIIYPLFGEDITTANDLLEKNITTILNGYIEDKDYTMKTDEDCTTYTFPFTEYSLGSNPNLILYVDTESSIITKVQYAFRIADTNSNINYGFIIRKNEFTNYYDADPVYTYLDNNGKHIKLNKDGLWDSNKKTTYYVTWESSKGKLVYSFTNLYEEKKEYGTLTFTKN